MPGKVFSLQELADFSGGEVIGDPTVEVRGLNGIEFAAPGEITFLLERKHIAEVQTCQASSCIVPTGIEPLDIPVIEVDRPDIAAARIHNLFLEKEYIAKGVHPTAVIGETCEISDTVTIGAHVVIGENVKISPRVTIHPGVIIEDNVTIGDDSVLFANVTVGSESVLGKRVVLHHGAIIGSDGFGFATDGYGNHISKPQVGNVRIDDDVQIGACSCVDRAAFGTTWIKSGVRIDNLVQIAHNVEIGENSVIVSQCGIAGSVVLGRSVVLGGKVGVKNQVQIGDGVMAAAMSGIHSNQPAGAIIGGAPAVDAKKWARASAAVSRLPDMMKDMRELRKEVDRLTTLLEEKAE